MIPALGRFTTDPEHRGAGRQQVQPGDVTPRAWAGLAIVAAASFVASLDAMVLYVAFGDIRRSFPDISVAALSWEIRRTLSFPFWITRLFPNRKGAQIQ